MIFWNFCVDFDFHQIINLVFVSSFAFCVCNVYNSIHVSKHPATSSFNNGSYLRCMCLYLAGVLASKVPLLNIDVRGRAEYIHLLTKNKNRLTIQNEKTIKEVCKKTEKLVRMSAFYLKWQNKKETKKQKTMASKEAKTTASYDDHHVGQARTYMLLQMMTFSLSLFSLPHVSICLVFALYAIANYIFHRSCAHIASSLDVFFFFSSKVISINLVVKFYLNVLFLHSSHQSMEFSLFLRLMPPIDFISYE